MKNKCMNGQAKNPFDYQKPSEQNVGKIQEVREQYKKLFSHLLTLFPSRENSIAIEKLEESAMWATKSLVFNEQ